jgi:hypothetical protein
MKKSANWTAINGQEFFLLPHNFSAATGQNAELAIAKTLL